MPPTYGFILPVAREGAAALQWCLGHFRRAFPDAPLKVIGDGVDDLGYQDVCKRFHADFVAGRYLKRIECGGAWWKRALEEGLKTGADWIVKFDPDTKFHRAFKSPPPGGDVSGTLDHKGDADENVLGGCQAIRREAARKILDSKILENPALTNHRTFGPDEPTLRHWRARAFMGSDMSLAWVARNLGLEFSEWPDVGIDWKDPAPEGDFAATHPHKMRSKPMFSDDPLRVITTCKGRLEHLKQTLPRWLAEPNVFVTVVDYDCPDGTADWVRANHPECEVIRVKDRPKFNLSAARNIGAQHATSGWWCFFDADLVAAPGWADQIRRSLIHKHYLLAEPIAWNQFGSVVVHSWDFKAAGGYDDFIEGWGAEDGDFYSRLRQAGVRPGSFPGKYTASIPHSDAERTAHYEEPDKKKTQVLFERYHTAKIASMLKSDRLPGAAERKEMLVEAYKASGIPLPGWYARGEAGPEPKPVVEVTRGKPMPTVPAVEKSPGATADHNINLTVNVPEAVVRLLAGHLKPAPGDQDPVPPATPAQRIGFRTWFLAWTRWSRAAVCVASRGLGLIDYHRRHDAVIPGANPLTRHSCIRCGKAFAD